MLGRTHFFIGISAALAVMQPSSMSTLVAGAGAAAIGGMISDIDSGTSQAHKEADKIMTAAIAITAVIIFADCKFHVGIYERLMRNSSIARLLIGAMAFIIICTYGSGQPHRSFMHSFLSMFMLTACMDVIYPDAAPYFAIAYASHKPLIGVHHIEGHVSANFIENPDLEPPFVCLIVSGGHTHLVIVKGYGEFEIIGRTRDDAAGEAFDKVARAVGLGYPGGPKVDKAAKEGNPHAMEFPRAKVADSPYDFSFSGLKSAVLNYINHAKMTGEEIYVPDLVASFQNAVVDVLVSRAITAAKEYGYKKLAIAGGVASNSALRAAMKEACDKNGITFYHPSPIFCTDNAAMIGVAAYYEYIKENRSGWDLNAVPNLKLGER